MNEIEIVKKNYDENPQKEWDRLDGFRYEFEITKAMFIKYLKPCKVLDIGGGLLIEKRYYLLHMQIMPEHIVLRA